MREVRVKGVCTTSWRVRVRMGPATEAALCLLLMTRVMLRVLRGMRRMWRMCSAAQCVHCAAVRVRVRVWVRAWVRVAAETWGCPVCCVPHPHSIQGRCPRYSPALLLLVPSSHAHYPLHSDFPSIDPSHSNPPQPHHPRAPTYLQAVTWANYKTRSRCRSAAHSRSVHAADHPHQADCHCAPRVCPCES